MHLTDFVKWLNEDVGGMNVDLDCESYGRAMADSMKRHYIYDRQHGGVRMSNLGKPAVVNALAKLGYAEPEPLGKLRYIFHTGDMFEAWLDAMLRSYGIEILDAQPEVEWNGVKGHGDFIVKSPVTGDPIVVEAKTMSENYHRLFKKEPNDDRGYVTQLALYTTGTGYDGTWVCLNKGNSEVSEIPANPAEFGTALTRAGKVLKRLDRVNSVEDVLRVFRPPPPVNEVFKRQVQEKMVLPPSMRYSPFASALYKLSDGYNGYNKPTRYVDELADEGHLRSELDFLVETGALIKA